MIDLKQAVKSAFEFVEDVYGQDSLNGLLLEEVELSDDEKYWLITIGFDFGRTQTTNPLIAALGTTITPNRVYKSVKIDTETGKALSLKIKKI